MNLLGAVASRYLCSSPRALPKCHNLDSKIIKLVHCAVRPYSISSTPFSRKALETFSISVVWNTLPRHGRTAFKVPQTIRTYASARIITRYNDLPRDYKDEEGLPFRATPISAAEAAEIFGMGMQAGISNHVLRVLHGRRVAGTLDDPALPSSGFDATIKKLALAWLRKNVPVDEDDAAGQRAEMELAAMEDYILADSERLGLYKPNSGETDSKRKVKGSKSVYGESGLDAIRKMSEERWRAEEKIKEAARKKQAAEIRQNTGTLTTAPKKNSKVELRERGSHPWLKYYLERSKVLPDKPPEMTILQRCGPSGLVTLLVLVGSIIFAQVYTPPTAAGRLWPDMPPAAATIIGLIMINSAIFVAWHMPPFFRILNLYFMSVPGYPRALAMIGNIFSHQTYHHLGINMLMLWFVGTRLHDDIGRGNFLAIYMTSGVIASFASLLTFAIQKNFVTSSIGASGAICGVIGAYLWLHAFDNLKFFGLPPDPWQGLPGWVFLIPLLGTDIAGLSGVGKTGSKYDHYAHLVGYLVGMVGAQVIQKSVMERQAAMERRRQRISIPSPKQ